MGGKLASRITKPTRVHPRRFQPSPTFAMRLLRASDAGALYALVERNRARLRRWLSWLDAVRGPDDVRILIANAELDFERGRALRYGLFHHGSLAGTASLLRISAGDRTAALGYWLGAAYEGRGLISCAAAVLSRYGLETAGLGRIELGAATDNAHSRAVAERLGFHFEGVLRCREWLYDHHVDHAVYSLTARDRLPPIRTPS